MRYFRYLFAIILIVILYCAEGLTAQKKEFTASVDKDGIQRVEVVGGEYFFDPELIIIRVNMPVEMKIRKDPGIVPHNIVIKEPAAGIDFNEGLSTEPKIIRFTPVKTGEYHFYCDKKPPLLKSHKDKGMVGVFRVIE